MRKTKKLLEQAVKQGSLTPEGARAFKALFVYAGMGALLGIGRLTILRRLLLVALLQDAIIPHTSNTGFTASNLSIPALETEPHYVEITPPYTRIFIETERFVSFCSLNVEYKRPPADKDLAELVLLWRHELYYRHKPEQPKVPVTLTKELIEALKKEVQDPRFKIVGHLKDSIVLERTKKSDNSWVFNTLKLPLYLPDYLGFEQKLRLAKLALKHYTRLYF